MVASSCLPGVLPGGQRHYFNVQGGKYSSSGGGPERSMFTAMLGAACLSGRLSCTDPAVSEPEPQLAQLEPVLEEVVVTAGQDLAKTSLDDYAAMRDDQLRTEAYAAAIRERVSMGAATVLDIGTGPFALLATIAANAGARKVYAIERTPSVAQEAQKFVEDAGLQEVISVISGNSQDVVLPEKVDLIVSELVGNVHYRTVRVPGVPDAIPPYVQQNIYYGQQPVALARHVPAQALRHATELFQRLCTGTSTHPLS
eukprot:g921.t2